MYLVSLSARVSEAEIARRCRESEPRWESYQEDVKGLIGAAPTAEWSGRPAAVTVTASGIKVEMLLTGAWASREAVIPLLVRDATGSVLLSQEASGEGARRTYHFPPPPEQGLASSLELRYPHGEAWIPLDADGAWQAPEAPSQ